MPAISDPLSVKYLAFEGGGGKGIAYLGAITALEDLGVLAERDDEEPIPISRISGVSGASAGAMTAFLVALGADSRHLAEVISKRETFLGFYDGPDNDRLREVHRNRYREGRNTIFDRDSASISSGPTRMKASHVSTVQQAKWKSDLKYLPFSLFSTEVGIATAGAVASAALGPYVGGLLDPVTGELPSGIRDPLGALGSLITSPAIPASLIGLELAVSYLVKAAPMSYLGGLAAKNPAVKPLVEKLTASDEIFDSYVYNLLFERGLFPGFKLREFLQDQLVWFLRSQGRSGDDGELRRVANNVTFEDLAEETGIDLAVTGINVTTHRPGLFSRRTTPSFPVIDAVGISSSFPFAFKPVLVTGCDDVDDGYWLDGGVLNNLPIHAFDVAPDRPLEPGMLALRLEALPGEDSCVVEEVDETLERVASTEPQPIRFFDVVSEHAGDLLSAFGFPSEAGQLRTESEAAQTVQLDTSGLNTLEFAPSLDRIRPRVKCARTAIFDYFGSIDIEEELASPGESPLEELLAAFK